jgi:hypothetical protein
VEEAARGNFGDGRTSFFFDFYTSNICFFEVVPKYSLKIGCMEEKALKIGLLIYHENSIVRSVVWRSMTSRASDCTGWVDGLGPQR